MESKEVRVGVGVILKKDGKILIGKRMGSHGAGAWALPGGHMDYGESYFDTAHREVMEEAGITIKNLKKGPFTNDYFKEEDKHYVTLFIEAEYDSGELKILEPHKCLEWRWVDQSSIPKPVFLPLQNLLEEGYTF